MTLTLRDLQSFCPPRFRRGFGDPEATGNPNQYTRATAKGHIHVINPAARPSLQMSSKARTRRQNKIFR